MTWPEIYICHYGHEYDQIFTENLATYFNRGGVVNYSCELSLERRDEQLREIIKNPHAVVLGYNSQLDHSYIYDQHFVTVAANKQIPVIQWILDHPASRWSEFDQRSSQYSSFLLNTGYEKLYFERFCAPGANTGLMGGIGPNTRSRVSENSKERFLARPEKCLIPLGMRRIGKTLDETLSEISLLDIDVARIINRSVDTARFDLEGPLETHLIRNLQEDGVVLDVERFNSCFRMMEDCVQAYRRLTIFEIARRYPICILSDDSAAVHVQGATAEFLMNVNMQSTLSRMPNYRSVLSVSPVNDLIHDRTMNAINAGCVPIIEDNNVHRRIFEHEKNALMFRYGDNSLDKCLNIVCNQPELSWQIAEQAFVLRNDPRVFCVSFCNVVDIADRQLTDLRGTSGVVIKGDWEGRRPLGVVHEVVAGSEPLGPEKSVQEREQLRAVTPPRTLDNEVDIKERLESAREAVRLSQSMSVAFGADLRARNDHLVALQRTIESIIRGEADLVVEILQTQVAEARGEALHLRARLSLLVEQLEEVQQEHTRIFVLTPNGQEVAAPSRSLLEPPAPARPETMSVRILGPAVVERDNRILKLGQEIIDLDSRIRALERELLRRNARILELGQDVANRDDRILELGQEVTNRDDRILELGQEVANRNDRILELELQFAKLMNSFSWRVTTPLRAVVDYMGPSQVRLLGRIIKLCNRSSRPD